MSILIEDMEMPKSCSECLEIGWHYVFECWLDDMEDDKRLPDCPLIELPPHGGLIDRAELWVEINTICDRRDAGIISDLTCLQQILSAVRHAPTIIPAEEGE